jgi:hypothetical protein
MNGQMFDVVKVRSRGATQLEKVYFLKVLSLDLTLWRFQIQTCEFDWKSRKKKVLKKTFVKIFLPSGCFVSSLPWAASTVVRNAFDAEDSFKILYFQILVWWVTISVWPCLLECIIFYTHRSLGCATPLSFLLEGNINSKQVWGRRSYHFKFKFEQWCYDYQDIGSKPEWWNTLFIPHPSHILKSEASATKKQME